MITIDNLNTIQQYDAITQIANLERMLHTHDAWDINSVTQTLEQRINHGVLICCPNQASNNLVLCYCLYQQLFEVAEILRIGTHPDFQRQGLAKRLIKDLILHLSAEDPRVERLLLEVAANNKKAVGLYRTIGFAVIDTRKNYYRQQNSVSIDALIMQYTF